MMKKKRKKMKKKIRKRKISLLVKGIFAVIGILIILLLFLVLANLGIFEKSEQPKFFSVTDECSIVIGNLIHQVRDAGDCKIRCINECDIQDMKFDSIEFSSPDNSCNICDCYCN